MVVLSLFDGMSCGQIALTENGVQPTKYYASEIDKHAIKQTRLNFPNTIHLGDVQNWQQWQIDWGEIDLILAGSPCQGFSNTGSKTNFEHKESRLFFAFIDILNHARKFNPGVMFLLENVKMKKEWENVITEYMKVKPLFINSSYFSAQSRKRLYWTNIPGVREPQESQCNDVIADILEDNVDEKYFLAQQTIEKYTKAMQTQMLMGGKISHPFNPIHRNGVKKAGTVTTQPGGRTCNWVIEPIQIGTISGSPHEMNRRVYAPFGVTPTILTGGGILNR